jgi:2-oxoisovalerate dehydrogenase E2 component (dihydrolipoyl transacylase)
MMGRQHVIKMPDIGEGIAEVELVAWHVKPGDTVTEDQVLADVMTDKANVEIPSPVAGTVVALGGDVGQTLPVGSELIRIEVAGEADPATAKAIAAGAMEKAASLPPPAPAGESRAGGQRERPAAPIPTLPQAGKEEDAQVVLEDRPIASPAVRRRAWELGIDLHDVKATGLAGRIVQADLDTHVEKGGRRAETAAPRSPGAAREPRTDEQPIKIIGLRRKIAQKMQEAKRRIPHFTYVEEVDVTEIEALRQRLNERWGKERPKLTLLPFLVRAVVLAVRDFPQVNARFDD